MFCKPFRVKSNTQMKGSDRKKLKAEVKKRFSQVSDSLLDELIAPKDEITVSKVYTFSGESYLVYFQGKDPIFFEPEKERGQLMPTVYSLWKCPQILPTFATHPQVHEKLVGGADLMLPGVVVNQKLGIKAYLDGKVKKGDLVSVSLTNNIAPIAIGNAAMSSEDMYMSGHRGKGVIILHCFGDQLWSSGSKSLLPDLGKPEGLEFNDESTDDEERPPEDGADSAVTDGVTGREDDQLVSDTANLGIDQEKDEDHVEADEEGEAEPETASQPETAEQSDDIPPEIDMDELLETAFLRACKISAKKIEFPILTSNFYRVHMVAACPPGVTLDVKKSSYKKLSKFLSKMAADNLIQITEPKKGVEMMSKINYEHPTLETFRVVKYEVSPDESNSSSNPNEHEPPALVELRLVTADVSKFFRSFGYSKGDGLTLTQVRECVKAYVERKGLQDKSDPKQVSLDDPTLSESVFVKGEYAERMPWEKVISRVMSKMSMGFSMTIKGRPPMIVKGKLELIELSVASRSGNKKVTLVHNLDIFGIDLADFSHRCQVGVAASTSVHEAPNKKRAGGQPVPEVLIQGNQVAFVGKLLTEHYKLPKKYIRGLELAAKGKKGK